MNILYIYSLIFYNSNYKSQCQILYNHSIHQHNLAKLLTTHIFLLGTKTITLV